MAAGVSGVWICACVRVCVCVCVKRGGIATQRICITFVGRVAIVQLGAVKDTRKKISVESWIWVGDVLPMSGRGSERRYAKPLSNFIPLIADMICGTAGGDRESLLYRQWLLNWVEMSSAGFNNKLIAIRFRRESRTPPRDLKRAHQELKIGPSIQPSCADGLILLSPNDFEYSERSAGLRAQQVVGPLISARRCRWNLNHGVTSGSWNHNMNSESQLWSCCHFVFGSLERMMYWKTDNEQTTFCCRPYGSVRPRVHTNNMCIRAYIAYFTPYIHPFSSCRIICEDVLHCIIQTGVSGAQ